MNRFYKITQLFLTREGRLTQEANPDADWGCDPPFTEETIKVDYDNFVNKNERPRLVGFKGKPNTFENWKEVYLTGRSRPNFKYFDWNVRGYLKNENGFQEILDFNREDHFPIHEGSYYTHFVSSPTIFGLDVIANGDPKYFTMNPETKFIEECERFEAVKNILF